MDQHCSEETLSAYLDGDLASEQAGAAAEHLAECEVCRQVLAQVRAIRDAAPQMEQLVPPERVWRAIGEAVTSQRPKRVPPRKLFWVGVPALAAALLVVATVGGFGPSIRNTIRRIASLGRAAADSPVTTPSGPSDDKAATEVAREYSEYVHGIDRAIGECAAAMVENPGNARVWAAYRGANLDRQRAIDRLASGGQ